MPLPIRDVARCALLVGALVVPACCARDARPRGAASDASPVAVAVGVAVDTLPPPAWGDFGWTAPVPEIFRAWRSYLEATSRPDPARVRAAAPAWSAAERARAPVYDLVRARVGYGVAATVLEVRNASPASTDAYVVKTLYTVAPGGAPIALGRVYATREPLPSAPGGGGRWVFSGALARETRGWRTETVGPITYVIQPGYPFDRARAARAVAFLDSVAAAFALPRVTRLTYYLTRTPDDMNRIVGLDWYVTAGGGGGGFAPYANHQLFVGDPTVGEEYRHELAHFVLGALPATGARHWAVTEGVATWLGGTLGLDAEATLRAYARYLARHPEVTLDSALASPATYDRGTRPAGALLCAMVFERRGVDGIKALLEGETGSDAALRAALERLLDRPWPAIRAAWRAKAGTYDRGAGG